MAGGIVVGGDARGRSIGSLRCFRPRERLVDALIGLLGEKAALGKAKKRKRGEICLICFFLEKERERERKGERKREKEREIKRKRGKNKGGRQLSKNNGKTIRKEVNTN